MKRAGQTRRRCSVIVPVYNGASLAERCIAEIRRHPPSVDYEIILVDDASPDGSAGRLSRMDDVVLVRREGNGGFAAACNDGARAASGDLLVFLNNDTLPEAGWLDALVDHRERNPRAGVIGSKLLYPNRTVQHAGVVIGQDGSARHLYSGFSEDHPAVNRPRVLQAVTAACMLVERSRFLALNGFDDAFRNGMEDVDFCLRIRRSGLEVHYCPESTLIHLESVTRGRRTPDIKAGIRLFRERWGGSLEADDLQVYQDDGLLRIRYGDAYPIQIELAPELAVLNAERAGPLDRCLHERSRQATDLLRDLVELSVRVAEDQSVHTGLGAGNVIDPPRPTAPAVALDHPEITRRIEEIALSIHDLQVALNARSVDSSGLRGGRSNEVSTALPTGQLAYRDAVARVRATAARALPAESTVLVVSGGEDTLLRLGQRTVWHFPRSSDGEYAGYYPADGDSAVAHLEDLREAGAEYLVLPREAEWWLEHYPEFAAHLRDRYSTRVDDESCTIYSLVREDAHVAVG